MAERRDSVSINLCIFILFRTRIYVWLLKWKVRYSLACNLPTILHLAAILKYKTFANTQKFGVLLKASPRPTAHGPRLTTARWPSPDFSQFFFPAVNSRTCTDLYLVDLVWACKIDDGEFEFGCHFNNHLNPFQSFLSLLVVKWKTLSFSVYSSVDRTR